MLEQRLVSTEEAARYLGVSSDTVRDWIHRGRLQRVPVNGRKWRVDKKDLDALIEHLKGYGGHFR